MNGTNWGSSKGSKEIISTGLEDMVMLQRKLA